MASTAALLDPRRSILSVKEGRWRFSLRELGSKKPFLYLSTSEPLPSALPNIEPARAEVVARLSQLEAMAMVKTHTLVANVEGWVNDVEQKFLDEHANTPLVLVVQLNAYTTFLLVPPHYELAALRLMLGKEPHTLAWCVVF